MKKTDCVIITASPRAGSNSTAAARVLQSQITDHKSQIVDINKLKIHSCTACDKCREGLKCGFDDDAGRLIKQIERADVVIVSSPIYFTGVPGPLKTFIDRNQLSWYKRERKPKAKSQKLRKGIIILTAGENKEKYFRPAESEIRAFFAVNNIKTKYVFKLAPMDEKGSLLKDKKIINRLKTAGKSLQ